MEAFEHTMAMNVHVAACLSQVRVRKCVYVSSTFVYGDRTTNDAVTEQTVTDPSTPYAIAKLAGEFLMRQAAEGSGVPLVVLRVCGFYGPGDPHVESYGPARFIKSALNESGFLFRLD